MKAKKLSIIISSVIGVIALILAFFFNKKEGAVLSNLFIGITCVMLNTVIFILIKFSRSNNKTKKAKMISVIADSYKKNRSFLLTTLLIAVIFIVTFLGIWFLVCFLDKIGFNTVGTREMWIGLLGSLVGGFFSFLGVNYSIYSQKDDEKERQRLEHMPILKVDYEMKSLPEYKEGNIFTLYQNEILTSAFPTNLKKKYPVIVVSLSNKNSAYEVYIESCITIHHTEEITKSPAFNPEKYRVVPGEYYTSMVYIMDADDYEFSNILCVLRISYSDIFGNKYYQDVPFSYTEHAASPEYVFETYNLKKPILVERNTPTLFDISRKEYSYLFPKEE